MKTRRDSAKVHVECKSVLVIDGKDHDQQHRDNGMAKVRKVSSDDGMERSEA